MTEPAVPGKRGKNANTRKRRVSRTPSLRSPAIKKMESARKRRKSIALSRILIWILALLFFGFGILFPILKQLF